MAEFQFAQTDAEDRWTIEDVLQCMLGGRALQLATLQALRRVRMTSESWLILEALHTRPRIMSELAEDLSMQKGSLSRWVARLEEAGFVRCRHDPRDQRRKTATLTKTGRLQLHSARNSLAEMLADFDYSLTASDREAMMRLSRGWHAALGRREKRDFDERRPDDSSV